MPEVLISCPHCGRETLVHQQRCQACGLTMLSDREFALLEAHYWPAVDQLAQQDPQAPTAEARQAFQTAAEVAAQVPIIQPHHAAVAQRWRTPLAYQAQYQRTLRFHWLILAFFVLVAVISTLYTADWTVGLLMALPVAGWYWLGIHRLRAAQKQRRA